MACWAVVYKSEPYRIVSPWCCRPLIHNTCPPVPSTVSTNASLVSQIQVILAGNLATIYLPLRIAPCPRGVGPFRSYLNSALEDLATSAIIVAKVTIELDSKIFYFVWRSRLTLLPQCPSELSEFLIKMKIERQGYIYH